MNVEAIPARLVAFHVLRLNAVAKAASAGRIDTIMCDPGDISRAHRSNEYIESGELAACQQMIAHLAA
jgi:acetylornithine deacetylase/succinyl-diaminopimelate desuccinylase-like protein